MKLLISAYACAPDLGSEWGVGWNWIINAHRLGHEVWALVSPVHRNLIQNTVSENPDLCNIHWAFPEVASWPLRQGSEPTWERSYNFLWQVSARQYALKLQREVDFDVIHHLTWAGIRAPTFLGGLGAPLIIGPVGGGETSPKGLRDQLGLRGRLLETLRDLSNNTISRNPFVRTGFQHAQIVFASTPETAKLLTSAFPKKVILFSQLAIPALSGASRKLGPARPFKFLFAGRLLYWKGVHIAIQAFAEVLRRYPDSRLTIVGKGPESRKLKRKVEELGIGPSVEFLGRVPQAALFSLYDEHDLFLFPSLHDSGGLAALEALAHGLPVICLNLGGPAGLVTPQSGAVIDTSNGRTTEVASRMAAQIIAILGTPGRLQALSNGAFARALQFLCKTRIERFYEITVQFDIHKLKKGDPDSLPAAA